MKSTPLSPATAAVKRQMQKAQAIMRQYRNTLRELAKMKEREYASLSDTLRLVKQIGMS